MTSAAPSDAAVAFEDLRAEISLLRRAIEGLTAERQAMPDYSPTLADMAGTLEAIVQWARKLNEKPALQRTGQEITQDAIAAVAKVRAEGVAIIQAGEAQTLASMRRIDGIVARHREAHEQRRWVLWTAVGSALAGILLGSLLSAAVGRGLSMHCHLPQRLPTRVIAK